VSRKQTEDMSHYACIYYRSNQFAREEQEIQWFKKLNVNINGRS